MTGMSDCDADLKRAFALADEPPEDGFSDALAARVAAFESRRRVGRGVQGLLMACAFVAAFIGIWQALEAVWPRLMASVGPDLAMLATAQTPIIPMGMPFLLILGAAAGAGVAWLRRAAD